MQRVGLGGWVEAFQQKLPTNCSSIARLRETSTQDLHKLGFKLSPMHVRQVLGALRKEPLATELADTNGTIALQPGGPAQGQRTNPDNTGREPQKLADGSSHDRGHVNDNGGHNSIAAGTEVKSEQLDMSVDVNSDAAGDGSENGGAVDDVQG